MHFLSFPARLCILVNPGHPFQTTCSGDIPLNPNTFRLQSDVIRLVLSPAVTNVYVPYRQRTSTSPSSTHEMKNPTSRTVSNPSSALSQHSEPPIVQVTGPDHPDHCTDCSGSSSINFSLCTPDSPTAVYEFDQIASRFPLPLDHNNASPVRAERNGKVELLDVPEEIAAFTGEEGLIPYVHQNLFEDYRHGTACINRDLAAWRFQCHRDANLSATSLPISSSMPAIEPGERNLSVISLPASLSDLNNSTATSATFAPSPSHDNTSNRSRQGTIPENSKPQQTTYVLQRKDDLLQDGNSHCWPEYTQGM